MKESIYAAIHGVYGKRVLPAVGTNYDDDHTVIVCPVCKRKTLDNHDICNHCGWEYDGFDEDHYSVANRATLADYKKEFIKAIKCERSDKNV